MSEPRVLVAHPGPLIPPQGGGDVRTLSILKYFRGCGLEVHLLTQAHRSAGAIASYASKVWFATPGVAPDENLKPFRSFVRRARRRLNKTRTDTLSDLQRRRDRTFEEWCFEVSYKIRPAALLTPFAWNARLLDRIPPDALGILDTIDVQHVRAARAREAGGNLDTRWCTREEEQRELERADVLIAMQSEEATLLHEMCPESRVIVAGHACEATPAPLPASSAPALLFVANLYDPNVRGIENFMRDVWPQLRKQIPTAELSVCGRVCEALSNPPDGVRLLGYVRDLDSAYARTAVMINPVPYSTGLSVKVCEALARGRCVVASRAGIRGLDEHADLPVTVADTSEATLNALLELLGDPNRRERETRCWEWAKRNLAPESVYKPILEAIRNRAEMIRL